MIDLTNSSQESYKIGHKIAVYAKPKSGFTFAGWQDNAERTAEDKSRDTVVDGTHVRIIDSLEGTANITAKFV